MIKKLRIKEGLIEVDGLDVTDAVTSLVLKGEARNKPQLWRLHLGLLVKDVDVDLTTTSTVISKGRKK